MSKPEFGRKMTCTACAVRFYDLTRTPAICPKCGVEQPRVKPRVAPLARASAVRWSGRQPPTIIAATPEPTLVETDPLEEVEEVEEDDVEEIDLPDDDDDQPKVKVED